MDKIDANQVISDFLDRVKKIGVRPLLVLLGPTASGKTALSIELAKTWHGEVISADSRQVYRHMDIGTDKIPVAAREGVPHHLLDIVNPDERFTVADFKKLAEEKIDETWARGNLPMLVGGTGLYIRAITQNFSIPKEDKNIRAQIMAELAKDGKQALYDKLQKLDPAGAAKIHPNNIPYVVRALEIFMATGKGKNDQKAAPKYECLMLGLKPPREVLFEKINARVDEQIDKNGLIEETKKLLAMGFNRDIQSMRSLGYAEIIKYLDGTLTLDEARELLKINTRNFAKRQMTWFKKDVDVIWL
ncbi:MAG: tRNA (adenosine(37)-N6)-dimethylallyltransferase MiaA [Patescibacteria group bacterium]